jgi:hypothetical protein
MKPADPVPMLGHPQSENRHVEGRVRRPILLTEAQEFNPVYRRLIPIILEVLLQGLHREGLMGRRHWRVGGKDRAVPDALGSLLEAHPARDFLFDAFEDDKGGVTLIQVPERGPDAQTAKHSHATDAQ